MAELAGSMADAIEEPAVGDHRPADSGTDEHRHRVGAIPGCSVVPLAPRRGPHVVNHHHRNAKCLFQLGAEGHVVPFEIGGEPHYSAALHLAGDADAESVGAVGGDSEAGFNALGDVRDDGGYPLPGVGGMAFRRDDIAALVDEGREHLGASEIDPQRQHEGFRWARAVSRAPVLCTET